MLCLGGKTHLEHLTKYVLTYSISRIATCGVPRCEIGELFHIILKMNKTIQLYGIRKMVNKSLNKSFVTITTKSQNMTKI